MDGLIGREDELAAIGAALRRPDLAGIVLLGEAGVGKSHLLATTLQHASQLGFATVSIHGTRALADIPLAAFGALLPSRLAGDAGDLVQIRRTLQRRAASRPLVLGVDDAHLLDEASAALVHQLGGDLTAFVVAAARTGEPAPEGIIGMIKDGLAQRLVLTPLQRDAINSFAERTLGAPVDDDVADELWERTLGNPLFARELLLQARDRASLVYHRDRFHLRGSFGAPETLSDLIESRLAGLSDAHQRAAALVAVGGPLDVDLLERLVDPDVLVELEEARVLAADEADDRLLVRFVHPLYADATRRRLGRLSARQMLRELADTLEAMPRRSIDDVLRIATWRHDAGADAEPALLLDAARLATRRHDHALAERLAVHAFEDDPSLAAATVAATSLVEQGRYAEARAWLHDDRLDRSAAGDADRAGAAFVDAAIELWGLGDAAAAREVLVAARHEVPAIAVLADGFLAAIAAACSRPHDALEAAPIGSPAAQTPFGAFALLSALSAMGRPVEALTLVPAPSEHDQLTAGAILSAAYAFTMIEAGQLLDALTVASRGYDAATSTGDQHGRVAWAIVSGWAELNFGRRNEASRWFAEAAALAPRSAAAQHGLRWALGGLLLTAAIAGELDAARGVRAQLDELPPHDATVHSTMEVRGRCWLEIHDLGLDHAVDHLARLAAEQLEQGNVGPWLRMVTDIGRMGRPELAARLVTSQPIVVEGPFLTALLQLVAAQGNADPEASADAAERLARGGYRVFAAEGAAWAWQHATAKGLDQRTIAQYGRRAQELREQIDAFATAAFSSGPPEVTLSRREREIAVLVAQGRTSREVADELIIGVRTVESHLARVYAKLGVRSRTDLGEALGLTGATP